MLNVLDATFGHPRGPLGRLGGVIMARLTGQRNGWTVSLFAIGQEDRILEVGCGPGALIQALEQQRDLLSASIFRQRCCSRLKSVTLGPSTKGGCDCS